MVETIYITSICWPTSGCCNSYEHANFSSKYRFQNLLGGFWNMLPFYTQVSDKPVHSFLYDFSNLYFNYWISRCSLFLYPCQYPPSFIFFITPFRIHQMQHYIMDLHFLSDWQGWVFFSM